MKAPKTWVGLVVAAAIAGGCAASDEAVEPPMPIDDGEELPPEIDSPADDGTVGDGTVGEIGDEGDVLSVNADVDVDPVEPVAAAGDQIVFVNFKGPTIHNCANYCSDALTNRSFVMGAFGKSAVDFAPYTDAVRRGAILRRLRALYAKYRVTFVTTRPASGPYTMLVISPTSSLPHHGVAPLDCGNADKSDIAFVYKIGGVSADLIARFAAHELGHSFGLAHVVGGDQVMQWASSGAKFGASNYDTGHPSGKCFNGTTQHAGAMLTATLGLR